MDPFLEDPAFWEGFHDVLISFCMIEIEKGLPDGYISNVKERAEVISVDDPAAKVYVPDIGVARKELLSRERHVVPAEEGGVAVAAELEAVTIASVDSIEVREAYIQIERLPGYEIVSVIELMSPWNKYGAGVGIHRSKRAAMVRDGIHFVEIELLRAGTRTKLAKPLPAADYFVNVFRADRTPDVNVYSWKLRDKLPAVPIPLRRPDHDVLLDLRTALHTAYEQGRYDRKLRYARPLDPPLSADEMRWTGSLLQSASKL